LDGLLDLIRLPGDYGDAPLFASPSSSVVRSSIFQRSFSAELPDASQSIRPGGRWKNRAGQAIGWKRMSPLHAAQGRVLITHGNAGAQSIAATMPSPFNNPPRWMCSSLNIRAMVIVRFTEPAQLVPGCR